MQTNEIHEILRRMSKSEFDPSLIEESSRAILMNYQDKILKLYKEMASQPQLTTKPTIHISITNETKTEAAIGPMKADTHYVAVFSYGIFANLYACFSGLLAHPAILPHIGNSSNTRCGYTIAEMGLSDFTFDNEAVKNNTPFSQGFPIWNYSKDEDRILYTTLLCDFAIQFIVYHEWGHLLGGHLSYLQHQYGINEINEMGVEDHHSNPTERLMNVPIRKAMEFEADYIAASMLTGSVHFLIKDSRTPFQAYPASFLAKYDPRDALLFAMMSLFHLFQEVRISSKTVNSKLYPLPFLRFSSLLWGMYDDPNSEVQHIWHDYEFKGVTHFAEASKTLGFPFLFSDQIYNDNARKRNIIKMDKVLIHLRQHLAAYRLTASFT